MSELSRKREKPPDLELEGLGEFKLENLAAWWRELELDHFDRGNLDLSKIEGSKITTKFWPSLR
jgi:hypothetical protein